MRSVLPDLLWIGNAREARDAKGIADAGIEAVVDFAANEPPAVLLRDVIYFRIPLVDGEANSPERLRLAVGTIQQFVRERIPTLVACSHGMSRSPTVTAFAIAQLKDMTPSEAAALAGGGLSRAIWESLTHAHSQ